MEKADEIELIEEIKFMLASASYNQTLVIISNLVNHYPDIAMKHFLPYLSAEQVKKISNNPGAKRQ